MAELADAYGSGPYGGNPMEVQVLSPAPFEIERPASAGLFRIWGQLQAPCHSFRKPTYFGVKRCASFLLMQRCFLRACLACYYSAENLNTVAIIPEGSMLMEMLEFVLLLLAAVLVSAVLDQVTPRVSLPLVQIALGAVII